MKLRYFPLAALLVGAAAVAAQPYGYPTGPMPYGPGPMPYGPGPGMQGAQQPGPTTARPGFGAPRGAPAAQAAPTPSPTEQASTQLKEGIDKLIAFLGQKEPQNKLQVAAYLDREIAPYFDFPYMAQWVAGPAYAAMSDEDKLALAARLEESFLSALTGYMAEYQGQEVRFLRPRRGPRGSVDVNVAILRAGSYPSKMTFRMYQGDAGWKVYDVVANGRSAAAYYRVRFQHAAQQGPGYPR